MNNVPYRQVIGASFAAESGTLEIVYLWRKKMQDAMLVRISGKLQKVDDRLLMGAWVEKLMHDAYEGACASGRRLQNSADLLVLSCRVWCQTGTKPQNIDQPV